MKQVALGWYLEVIKKGAIFGGRARRAEYWYFQLVNFMILVVLLLPIGQTGSAESTPIQLVFESIAVLYMIAVFLPMLAVSVRRLHDTNRTGLWVLIGLIPCIGDLVLIIFYALDSQPGPNRYGPNPKGFDIILDR